VAPPGLLSGLGRNLRGGLRLLGLRRRPAAGEFVVSFDQVAALLIVGLFVWALLDYLHAEPRAPLALDGLFGWACYGVLGLIACALVARADSRAASTRALLVPALAVAPFLLVVFWLAGDLRVVERHTLAATGLGLLYVALLVPRLLAAAFGRARGAPLAVALLLLLAAPWAFASLNLDTRLWVTEDTAQALDVDDDGEAETLFYDQPARIAAAVARVRPAQAGKAGAYFVGFAGDGDQGVFRRETQFAADVFGARFSTQQRSVLLINDVEDRESWPLASVAGLTQTLKVLASRMNTEQDVLVLFLTSHGSEDGLEVSNGSLPLAQLGPAELREALDSSGIRWRLLVVSACYAGVFLEELKGDTTAIVTASDAAHGSFGCEDDRELTWFGEAFLKDSLPGSASLEEAFHKAAGLIAQREDAEHQIHSNPQLYVGSAMQRKLGELADSDGRRSFTVRR